jgi:hypothetical protein
MPRSNSEASTPRMQATYVQAMLHCARRLHCSEAPTPAPLPLTTAEAPTSPSASCATCAINTASYCSPASRFCLNAAHPRVYAIAIADATTQRNAGISGHPEFRSHPIFFCQRGPTSTGKTACSGTRKAHCAAGRAQFSSRSRCLPWPPSSCIHYSPSIYLSSYATFTFYPDPSSIFINYDHSKSPAHSSISSPKYHTSHELRLDAPL